MKSLKQNWIVFVFLWVALGCATSKTQLNRTQSLDKPYVILVSIDGYRSDYTDLYSPPALTALRARSASAALLPVYPSKTFTNHYSIATGLYAENHGIVANSFYDPQRKERYRLADRAKVEDGTWYGGEPIWVAAEKQGMLAANFFWPGSEAAIQGVRPSYFIPYNESIALSDRVQQVVKWLQLPADERPHFITLYFSEVDTAGHHFGPGSLQVKEAILKVDQAIGELVNKVQALPLPVNLVVVSDHGMQEVSTEKVEYLDDYTDLKGIRLEGEGPQVLLYAESPQILEKVYRDLKRRARHFHIFKRAEVPRRLHYRKNPRIGDAVIIARAPYSIGTHAKLKVEGGNHGFDVDVTPSMKAIFYASGPQVEGAQNLKDFRNIHVYPMILKILGLQLATPIDGDIQILGGIIKK